MERSLPFVVSCVLLVLFVLYYIKHHDISLKEKIIECIRYLVSSKEKIPSFFRIFCVFAVTFFFFYFFSIHSVKEDSSLGAQNQLTSTSSTQN